MTVRKALLANGANWHAAMGRMRTWAYAAAASATRQTVSEWIRHTLNASLGG